MTWAFSEYLEALAMVPQFVMIFRMGRAEITVVHYLGILALYRCLYICNWIYRSVQKGDQFSSGVQFSSGRRDRDVGGRLTLK